MPSLLDFLKPPLQKAITNASTHGPIMGGLLSLAQNPQLVKDFMSWAPEALKGNAMLFAPGEAAIEGPLSKVAGMYPELMTAAKGSGPLQKLGAKIKAALTETRETPAGADVTPPARTYREGVTNKGNVWVRQAAEKGNADRTLAVQFSAPLVEPEWQAQGAAQDFYNTLYSGARSGYTRPADFFELPQWQAKLAQSHPKMDVYVVRDPAEAKAFFKQAGYKNLAFSSLDLNTPLIKDIAASDPEQKIVVGGYADHALFKDVPNVKIEPSIESFVKSEGYKPKEGYDYRHFQGTETVPRLTMSSGCTHNCKFCAIPKDLTMASKSEIMQQADNIGHNLNAKLVYLNDKTFGQAPNYKMLPEVYDRIKALNPDFEGFTVQTTATQVAKGNLTPQFLKDAHIQNVEVGVESYNNPILKEMGKPATEAMMDKAAANIREAGKNLIPNLIVGLPGETAETYAHTQSFLARNRDIISHPNLEYLELYNDSPLAKILDKAKIGQMGPDTASPVTNEAARSFYAFGKEQLASPSNTERLASEAQRSLLSNPNPQLNDLLKPPTVEPKAIKLPKGVTSIGRQEGMEGMDYLDLYNWTPPGSESAATFAVKPGETVEEKLDLVKKRFGVTSEPVAKPVKIRYSSRGQRLFHEAPDQPTADSIINALKASGAQDISIEEPKFVPTPISEVTPPQQPSLNDLLSPPSQYGDYA